MSDQNILKDKNISLENSIHMNKQEEMTRSARVGHNPLPDDIANANESRSQKSRGASTTESTNMLSNAARTNLKRIDSGEEPIVDTRYIGEATAYTDQFADETLEKLRQEFQGDEYKRKGIFGGMKADSTEMRNIMVNIDALIEVMNQPFVQKNASLGEKYIGSFYRQIIDYCNIYLGSKSGRTEVGARRKAMVKRIRTTCMRESTLLADVVKNTVAQMDAGMIEGQFSWKDMLRQCRSQQMANNDTTKLTVVGAGQSTIIKIQGKNGTGFFRPDESFKKRTDEERVDLVKDTLSSQAQMGEMSDEDVDKAAEMIKRVQKSINVDKKAGRFDSLFAEDMRYGLSQFILTSTEMDNIIKLAKQVRTDKDRYEVIKNAVYDLIHQETDGVLTKVMKETERNEEIAEVEHTSTFIKNMEVVMADRIFYRMKGQTGMEKAYDQALEIISKENLEYNQMKYDVKLPEGANITINNLATSRIAELLHLEEFVAKSTSAVVTIGGKTLRGTIMEDSGGDVRTKIPRNNVKMSGKVKRGLSGQGFQDYIMGQVDRHAGNYHLTYHMAPSGKVIIDGLKAIDNNSCGGLLTPEEIQKEGEVNRLQAIRDKNGKAIVPFMDRKLAETIRDITPLDVTFALADIYTPDQIKGVLKRLKDVQKLVQEQFELEKNHTNTVDFVDSEKDWEQVGDKNRHGQSLSAYNPHFFVAQWM